MLLFSPLPLVCFLTSSNENCLRSPILPLESLLSKVRLTDDTARSTERRVAVGFTEHRMNSPNIIRTPVEHICMLICFVLNSIDGAGVVRVRWDVYIYGDLACNNDTSAIYSSLRNKTTCSFYPRTGECSISEFVLLLGECLSKMGSSRVMVCICNLFEPITAYQLWRETEEFDKYWCI